VRRTWFSVLVLTGCALPVDSGPAVEALYPEAYTCPTCPWVLAVDGTQVGFIKKFSGLSLEGTVAEMHGIEGPDAIAALEAWHAGTSEPRTVELALRGSDGVISSSLRLFGARPTSIRSSSGPEGDEVSARFEIDDVEALEPESFSCATCATPDAWSYTTVSTTPGQRTIIGGFKTMSGMSSETEVIQLYASPDADQLAVLRAWRARGETDARTVELARRDAAGGSVERYRLSRARPTDVRHVTLADGTTAMRTVLRVEDVERLD
jgi:hypothetical protein